ncbi:hypothetical protein IJM86_08965 [bacterium]|nr:hypothetical protein [bacterium]
MIDKDEHNIQECQDNNSRLLKYAELIFSSKSFEVWILMHPSKFEKEVQSVQEYKKILNSGSNKQFFTKNGFN